MMECHSVCLNRQDRFGMVRPRVHHFRSPPPKSRRARRHVSKVPRTDSATVLNLLLTGSSFAVRSVLAIGDRLPALIGLVSLAVLAEVKKGDTKPPMGGQLDPKKDFADDDRCGGSCTSRPRISTGR